MQAMTMIDAALSTMANQRASLGAMMNRLSAITSNLNTSSLNLQASRSQMLDANMASEVAALSQAAGYPAGRSENDRDQPDVFTAGPATPPWLAKNIGVGRVV